MGFSSSPPSPDDHLRWIGRLSPSTRDSLNDEGLDDPGHLRDLEAACWHTKIFCSERDPDGSQTDTLDARERGQLRDAILGGALTMLPDDVPLDALILLRIEELLGGRPTLDLEGIAHRRPVGTVALNGPDGPVTTFGHPWLTMEVFLRSGMPGCLGNSVLSKGQAFMHDERDFQSIRKQLLLPDEGGEFTLTQQLSKYDDWTPGIVLERQRELAAVFLAAIGIDLSD